MFVGNHKLEEELLVFCWSRRHSSVITVMLTYPSVCYLVSLLVSSLQVARLQLCMCCLSPTGHNVSSPCHSAWSDYPNTWSVVEIVTSLYVCDFRGYHSGKVWGFPSSGIWRCITG